MFMKELTEIATKYAMEKTNQVIVNTIAKAYTDGYRDGYKDREEENPIDLHSDDTEFVDLGLPSGTLWSVDYIKKDEDVIYLPYHETENLQLPSEDLWKELLETCRWHADHSSSGHTLYGVTCIGPNGSSVYFSTSGYKRDNISCNGGSVRFWISDSDGDLEKNSVYIGLGKGLTAQKETRKMFSGYKLPIRLVRTK